MFQEKRRPNQSTKTDTSAKCFCAAILLSLFWGTRWHRTNKGLQNMCPAWHFVPAVLDFPTYIFVFSLTQSFHLDKNSFLKSPKQRFRSNLLPNTKVKVSRNWPCQSGNHITSIICMFFVYKNKQTIRYFSRFLSFL